MLVMGCCEIEKNFKPMEYICRVLSNFALCFKQIGI